MADACFSRQRNLREELQARVCDAGACWLTGRHDVTHSPRLSLSCWDAPGIVTSHLSKIRHYCPATHVHIWSLPGEGADIILRGQTGVRLGGREVYIVRGRAGGEAEMHKGALAADKTKRNANLAFLKFSFCQLNREAHPAIRQETFI